ncbi:30S ribosomal protein S21 [Candidatus Parcubacteria bacterium]|nr:30S ribosomal protein S21 [Candidatus Parcubacteria bacterium]
MAIMTTNVEVTRNGTENPLGLLRRFTKRVQGSGILPRVRGIRYHERTLSHYKRKMKTLESIKRREKVAEDIKLGKINPDAPRTRGRR